MKGLTNFDRADYPTYKETIRVYEARYGNRGAYYVSYRPMPGAYQPITTDYSLYLDRDKKHDDLDSSQFWAVYKEVREYLPTTLDKLYNKNPKPAPVMKTKTTIEKYAEAQKAFIEMTGLKVGSTVKILRKAKSYEFGWSASWMVAMKESGEFVIEEIDDTGGFLLNGSGYYYPFFIFEVLPYTIPDPIPLNGNGDYSAKFNKDGSVNVGCQKISYETLKNIYDAATKLKNA